MKIQRPENKERYTDPSKWTPQEKDGINIFNTGMMKMQDWKRFMFGWAQQNTGDK
jgi:hypothetical protein